MHNKVIKMYNNRTITIKRYRLSYDVVTCDVDQLYIENLINIKKKKRRKVKGSLGCQLRQSITYSIISVSAVW